MTRNNIETEVKLHWPGSVPQARARIRTAGMSISRRRVFEANTLFDTTDLKLRGAKQLLRVRYAGNSSILTYKGPPRAGRHKTREEIETLLGRPEQMELILKRLGYAPVFRYEKYRTEYQDPEQQGTITLDETPIGLFIEVEGQARWIDRTAGILGFSKADFINESYGTLYLKYCREHKMRPNNMTFVGK